MKNLPLPTTPRELKARYPYQFAEHHIELSFFRGWMPLFAQLCADIDAQLGPDKRGFHWVQLKEKFGSARWHCKLEPLLEPDKVAEIGIYASIAEINAHDERFANPQEMALRQRIQALRRGAEEHTQTACIVCSEPAEVDRSTGHLLVICPEHARQRRRGEMEPAWFTDEKDGPNDGSAGGPDETQP